MKIFLVSIFCLFTHVCAGSDTVSRIEYVIEHKAHNPENGLFCKFCQIMEWIYCTEQNKNLKLYINMFGIYGLY
jgi:hypothetical protein